MNQILMAAARGARIQTRYAYNDTFKRHGEWKVVSGMVFDPFNCAHPHEQRIHPDDEHLRFGPISTALREYARSGAPISANMPYLEGNINELTYEELNLFDFDVDHRPLFLLILSEALAEEGL